MNRLVLATLLVLPLSAQQTATRTVVLPNAFHYIPDGQSYLALTTTAALPLRIGNDATVTVSLSPTRATETTVTLANSNPQNLGVPSTIVIPTGSGSTTLTARSLAYGGGRITATVQVVAPKLRVNLPEHVDTTKDATGTIVIDPAQSTDTQVFLWGVDDLVSKLLVIPAGQTSLDFNLRDIYRSPHFQLLFPLYLGDGVAADMRLNTPPRPQITADASRYRVTAGTPLKARIVLGNTWPNETVVSFFPSAPGMSIAPITIHGGQTSAEFTINATTPGTFTVTAIGGAGDATFEVDVIAAGSSTTKRRSAGR